MLIWLTHLSKRISISFYCFCVFFSIIGSVFNDTFARWIDLTRQRPSQIRLYWNNNINNFCTFSSLKFKKTKTDDHHRNISMEKQQPFKEADSPEQLFDNQHFIGYSNTFRDRRIGPPGCHFSVWCSLFTAGHRFWQIHHRPSPVRYRINGTLPSMFL